MFYNSQFIGLIGSVPPPDPVANPAMTLTPADPGDLGIAPASWTSEIYAPGRTQVKYLVGVPGAKTIEFPWNAPNNTTVTGYNHGDTINFTGYGSGFSLTREGTTGNTFFAQGANGFDTFTIPGETSVSDIRYTIDGAGGTGPIAYTLLNIPSFSDNITVTFQRPGDRLIVKSVDETVGVNSGPAIFGGSGVKSISMAPDDPGDLVTAPANWTTRITAAGLTQVKWIVLDANWVGQPGSSAVVVDLVDNTALITCNFVKDGERLVVKSIDETVEFVSKQVFFSAVAKTLSIAPINPGNLGTAPANWTTVASVTGLPQVKWQVFNADGTAAGAWVVADVVNGQASITATFTADGQKLIVKSLDDAQQAVSGLVSFGVVAPPPAGSDYAFAYDFIKDMTVGVNVERDAAVGLDVGYFQRLKAKGVTHVRFFMPTKASWGFVGDGRVGEFLDSCANAIAAGLKVSTFDFQDVTEPGDWENSGTIPFIKRVCNLIAARNFDPRKIAFGPANEFAYMENVDYQPYREAAHDAMRAILPNHILVTASAYWGDPGHLTDGTMSVFADKRMLYQWHAYPWEAQQQYEADNIQADVSAWAASKGVVTICGEYGKNAQEANGNVGVSPDWIPDVVHSASRGAWQQRPTFWTVTNGSYWRMNNGNDFELTPLIGAAITEANTYIRAQSGFGT